MPSSFELHLESLNLNGQVHQINLEFLFRLYCAFSCANEKSSIKLFFNLNIG